jgi:KRAB domain-containing zinc finger protein
MWENLRQCQQPGQLTPSSQFECQLCGRRYVHKHGLEEHHYAEHLMEYRFRCSQCEKTFRWRTGWEKHKSTVHGGIKRWCCWVCGYRTASVVHYRGHLAACQSKIDSSPKYPCPKEGCEKRFFSSEALDVHLKTHDSGSETLPCETCGLEFSSEIEYFEHLGENPQCLSFGKTVYGKAQP